MSSDVYDVLDELAARGWRLRGQLPGDYKPFDASAPVADWPRCVHALILASGLAVDEAPQPKEAAA